MNRFVRRVPAAVASALIVGGAVLGAGGTASAATSGPVDRASVVSHEDHGVRSGKPAAYQEGQFRWDGHRLYVWNHGWWKDVTPVRNGSVDLWIVDQLLTAQH
ncbi:hypothetical protein ABZ845_10135 [Streptomyces sp. NPDC047022]|uniref:hypothetical protein n=1 Tax=Streptomyces sp. NPDC047022 TaxID=3155737 RepID=UPI0033C81FDA